MSSSATSTRGAARAAASSANDACPHEQAPGPEVLLIGYGNLLRSDDGVGPAIVSRLAASFFDNPICVTITTHQLTPELAVDVARAQRVVFVDASVDLPAGKAKIRRLQAPGGGEEEPVAPKPHVLGHHLSPETVLALARDAFGDGVRSPSAWAVAVGVANLSVGDRLSPPVSRTAGRLARHLAHRIRRWSTRASAPSGSDARKKG